MTDLTKITTPFGLLDKETQEALRAHGGPYEGLVGFDKAEWWEVLSPAWGANSTYRVKPQPPKPRECVIGFHGNGGRVFLKSVEYAEEYGWTLGKDAFLFREVL